MQKSAKILVIQTAFIGDVILATALLESLHLNHPRAELSILVRRGNEQLFTGHPFVKKVLVWDKKNKYKSLFQTLLKIRKEHFNKVVCVQRFFNAGFLAAFSGAKEIIGFKKNPLSFLFHQKIEHEFNPQKHETERNNALIASFCPQKYTQPKLYPPTTLNIEVPESNYITISPASVWFTKQFPKEKWIELLNTIPEYAVYILGAPSDQILAAQIITESKHLKTTSLCGKLSLLESALVLKNALMNYVNDSAPLHLASAMNAPVTAIFCSTIPAFGFGPLSEKSFVAESKENLTCRPCGIHGNSSCPKKHFNCAFSIEVKQLTNTIHG